MSTFTITLSNGVQLDNLTMNGSMYVSQNEVTRDILNDDALKTVSIAETIDGKVTTITLHNAVCDDILHWPEGWLFSLRNQTADEKMANDIDNINATASIAFVVMAENGTIDEVTATEHMSVFAAWEPGIAYAIGNLRTYGDKLYKCVQAHTSQSDWTPDVAVSLWSVAGDPAEEYPEWSQPIGAHDAYQTGDKVSHNGKHWISTADNNVWEPGVYGWMEVQSD